MRILEVPGDWRKLHNKELHNLNSSLNIVGMMKCKRMRWARHVASMGENFILGLSGEK
jgi:hypothetical protein